MKLLFENWRKYVKTEAIEPSQDIVDLRNKMGLPPEEAISDEEVASAMAGEERPITWDTITDLMKRIDKLELKVFKGIDL